MKKILRSDDEKAKNKEDSKNSMFTRLVQRLQNPGGEVKDKVFRLPIQTETLIQKSNVVKTKNLNVARDCWMQKRGLKEVSDSNLLAKQVFRLCSNQGEIRGSQFLVFLIEIGIPLHVNIIKASLSKLFHTKSIDTYKISENNIVALCKSDSFTNYLLETLLDHTVKIIKPSASSGDQYGKKNPKSLVSTVDIEKVLKLWWGELDLKNRGQVHLNDISEFLQAKNLVADLNEGRKLLFKLFEEISYIDYSQFTLIFSKSIIKWGLKQIINKVSAETEDSAYFSKDYNLAVLKKKLLMAGISYPVDEFTAEEGIAAIKGIEKYREMAKTPVPKMNYEDFRKHWGESTGQELQKLHKMPSPPKETHVPEAAIFRAGKEYEEDIINFSEEECITEVVVPKNKYTILGNYNIARNGDEKWRHSIGPEIKPFTVSNGEGKSKIKERNSMYMEFTKNYNHR